MDGSGKGRKGGQGRKNDRRPAKNGGRQCKPCQDKLYGWREQLVEEGGPKGMRELQVMIPYFQEKFCWNFGMKL